MFSCSQNCRKKPALGYPMTFPTTHRGRRPAQLRVSVQMEMKQVGLAIASAQLGLGRLQISNNKEIASAGTAVGNCTSHGPPVDGTKSESCHAIGSTILGRQFASNKIEHQGMVPIFKSKLAGRNLVSRGANGAGGIFGRRPGFIAGVDDGAD